MSEEMPRQVRVTFKRQVSDGNYGTEAAEVTVEDWVADDEDVSYCAEGLLLLAQTMVYGQLGKSQNLRVRQAVATPGPAASGHALAPDEGGRVVDDEMPF